MEIEVHNSKEDYNKFFNHFYFNKRTLIIRIVFAFAIGAFLFGGKYSETNSDSVELNNLHKFLLTATVVFALTTLLPYFIAIGRLALGKVPMGNKKFIITDDGFQVDSEKENVLWNWESIRTANVSNNFAYVLLYSHRAYILPTKYFSSEKDMNSFVGTIKTNALKVRSRSSKRKLWRLYWWGLLGIIPIVGAFAGLVLLFRGIFEFKDKHLVIIGLACILFTVGVYTKLHYDILKDEEKGGGFVGISQMQLNDLMKDVEFYKLQHGVYPDSLGELRKSGGIIGMWDPLQPNKGGNSNAYNYGKDGDKYYLFSSGRDGKPGTADDLYPKIANMDSSKFGLIRRQ